MDETGARIGCPSGQHVIVPVEVQELYTSSPENRKSVTIIETIIADGREPLPPFIITPGKKIMDNWIREELVGTEQIACSPTGYTNNEIAIQYLDHCIKHSHAGINKPWKILLLDGHESHHTDLFKLKAAENHIKLFWFPSHLTHALQPLDVGIFRPWKHYHNLAVQSALRSLDFEYTITSFFRDLTSIRKQTMQYHTICNSFKDSGMWPPSAKAGIKKMRSYSRKKQTVDDFDDNDDNTIELPQHPPTRATEVWTTSATVRALGDRDPTKFSEPSVELYYKTIGVVDIQLQKSHLLMLEHTALQNKLREESKRKTTSRRSIHKGGPSASIQELRGNMKARDEAEKVEMFRKAQKKLSQAINRARKSLLARGIQARKDEKARLERIRGYEAQNELPPLEDLTPIREPDKHPTELERLSMTKEFYPELLQQVKEAEQYQKMLQDQGNDLEIILGYQYPKDEVGDYLDSSPPPPNLVDSSDVESDAGSIDSIQRNADFVAF
jgi:hypothetical protein